MGRINTILFLSAKIVIIKIIAKFRAYSKIGIPLKIPTCKYAVGGSLVHSTHKEQDSQAREMK